MLFLIKFFTYDRYDGLRSFLYFLGYFLALFFSCYILIIYVFCIYFYDLEGELEDEDYVLTRELENEPQEDPFDEFGDPDFEEEIEIFDFSDEPYLHVPTHPMPDYNNFDPSFFEMHLQNTDFVVYDSDFIIYDNNAFMSLFDC